MFAERMTELRVKLGLTQLALARIVGVSAQNISNLEMGFKDPGVQVLKRLARALKCTTDYLLGMDS